MNQDLFEKMIDEEKSNKKELKKNMYGENYGTPWSKEEETKLLNQIFEDKNIEQISAEHKRSQASIHYKILQIRREITRHASTYWERRALTEQKL